MAFDFHGEGTAEGLLDEVRRVLREESDALLAAADRLQSEPVTQAVALLKSCRGRVVVTGMGKSGDIGGKFASTLASTGTPALFLHPAEGVHGDLGMITADDVLIAFSYSGETDEILAILPAVVGLGVPIIAFTGRPGSTLGAAARVVLDVCVEKEACYLNLAPTTSTTLMLALSDALAIAVMGARGFTASDYAARHPSGALGRRLLLRIRDVMRTGDAVAIVNEETLLQDSLFAITRAHAGAAIVVDAEGKVKGLITDGDLRRHIIVGLDCLTRPVRETMTANPGTVREDMLAIEGLHMLGEFHPLPGHRVAEAPVVDENGRPIGMLMEKDLIKAGII
ncbi:MAG TPA: KpsF/GutQ family sugar-phosphate isomerase [Capsulimonadaceae bacterium]|nr:KpsF/GutQ family sugar-phosphate isomerase [Capsulimonadaceae bacterium]